ncbi:MAG TPA: amidoligase family protein [Calditerricola sp.]
MGREICVGVELEVHDWTCSACDGDGRVSLRVECPECKGRGRVTCPECQGEGIFDCPVCRGTGRNAHGETCAVCDGRAEFICTVCDEEGKAECDQCGGCGFETLDEDCEECDGTGIRPYPYWAENGHEEHCGYELKGFLGRVPEDPGSWIEDFAAALAETAVEGDLNDWCGMHIHIGLPRWGFSSEEVEAITRLWAVIQPVVWEAARPRDGRVSYCSPNGVDYPKTADEYDELDAYDQSKARYHALNAWAAYDEHGTVEFRLWNATMDSFYIETALWISIVTVRLGLELDLRTDPGPEEARKITERFLSMLPEWIQSRLRKILDELEKEKEAAA